MQAGTSERHTCRECASEFEVLLEPTTVGRPELAGAFRDERVRFCPLCGADIPPPPAQTQAVAS